MNSCMRRLLIIHLLYTLFFTTSIAKTADMGEKAMRVIDMTTYLDTLSTPDDIYPAISSAIADCKKKKAHKLIFPKGEYRICQEKVPARFCHITNNGSCERRFAFNISNMNDFEIDGGGSIFLFSGFVCPFLVENCHDIELSNLTIDYERTFHSEGKIVNATDKYFDVVFGEEYPYEILNNRLQFIDSHQRIYPWGYILEMDPVKMETAYMAKDYALFGSDTHVARTAGDTVRIFAPDVKMTVGNVMVFGAANRDIPAITINDSENVKISNSLIYHCGAMGVIAQRSSNIALKHLDIKANMAKNRIVSATADATHFANCSGVISIDSCIFERQRDDATNIHGIYYRIKSIKSPKEMTIELAHDAQSGFSYLRPRMNIEIVQARSLITYQHAKIKEIKEINPSTFQLTICDDLSDSIKVNDVIAGDDEYPDVRIRNCRFGYNRARGLLIGTRGKVVIENCYFHTPGAAILFEGDARYWFEQAGVRNVSIRNNTFDNCHFGIWSGAVIDTGTGLDENYLNQCRYNRNILIEDNTFNIFSSPLLRMYVTSGLIFRNNNINITSEYPCLQKPSSDNIFQIIDCDNYDVRE